MSDPAELAKQFQKISLSHGVVLSHPLLKQMALKALEGQKKKAPPFPGGDKMQYPSTVKVSTHKSEHVVPADAVQKMKHSLKNLAEAYTKPVYAEGGYISTKYDTDCAAPPYLKYMVQGNYHYVKVSKNLGPFAYEKLQVDDVSYVDLLKGELWTKLCDKALKQNLNLIGKPAYIAFKNEDPWGHTLMCASHAIMVPPDIPSADKPIA